MPEGKARQRIELLEEGLALLDGDVGGMPWVGGVNEAAPVVAALGEDLVVAGADVGHRLGRDRAVAQRRAPIGGALKDREMTNGLGDLGDGLDARGAGPDHGHALAGKAHGAMRPQAGVPGLTLEGVHARDPRHGRRRQRPQRRDQEARAGGFAILEGDFPFVRRLVPVCSLHARIEGNVAVEVELVGEELAVAQVLRLAGEMLLPVPFLQHLGREGEAVGPAFRIEARPGIAVPVPGAADAAAGLVDPRPEAHLAQLQELVHARQAGADDDGIPAFDGLCHGSLP